MKEGNTLSPNATDVNLETMDNFAPEINIDSINSPLTMLNTAKSGMMEFCNEIDWVYLGMDSLKNKLED